MTEAQRKEFLAIRKVLDSFVSKIADSTVEINENTVAIRMWKPGVFDMNDVRMYDSIPYKCVQAHDSTTNEAWTPDVTPSLWIQYHGTSKETARAWIAPTGAHDMYKIGEYMIYTDEKVYSCISDTIYGPDVFPAAWTVEEMAEE